LTEELVASTRRYDDAIDCYERSLTIFRDIGDIHGQGAVLTNMGACYQALSRTEAGAWCHTLMVGMSESTTFQEPFFPWVWSCTSTL